MSENASLKERVSELNNLISSEKEKSSLLKDDLEKNVNESREMWEKSYSMEYASKFVVYALSHVNTTL